MLSSSNILTANYYIVLKYLNIFRLCTNSISKIHTLYLTLDSSFTRNEMTFKF